MGLCCVFGPSVTAPSSLICRGDTVLLLIPPEIQRETNLFNNLSSLPQFIKRRHATLCWIESRDRVADDNVITDCATCITDSLKKSNSAWLSHPSGVWYYAVAELRTRRYGAGDVIVREGDGVAGWQLVVEGQVETYKGKASSSSSSAAAAESSHVSTLHPGECYGDSDLSSNPAVFTHTLVCSSSSCTITSLSLSSYHLAVSKYVTAPFFQCSFVTFGQVHQGPQRPLHRHSLANETLCSFECCRCSCPARPHRNQKLRGGAGGVQRERAQPGTQM